MKSKVIDGVCSKTTRSRVIGTGSYGYIHYPPLLLEDEEDDEPDAEAEAVDEDVDENPILWVSKLLHETDAAKEERQYRLFQCVDPDHSFHLGNIQVGRLSRKNISTIAGMRNGKEIVENIDKWRIILMKHGGVSLRHYAYTFRCKATAGDYNQQTRRDAIAFWKDTERLVDGVQRMLQSYIVHHDIKPPNVVYDASRQRLNLIDFGLVTTMEHIQDSANRDDYLYSIFYYNMPPDMYFYHRTRFDHWRGMNTTERREKINTMFSSWTEQQKESKKDKEPSSSPDSTVDDYNYSYIDSVRLMKKELSHLRELETKLLKWCKEENQEDGWLFFQLPSDPSQAKMSRFQKKHESLCDFMCEGFVDFWMNDVDKLADFEDFMYLSMIGIDIYGLGYTLLYALIQTYVFLPPGFTTKMYGLICQMMDHHLIHRITVPDLLDVYPSLLAIL